MLPTLVPGDILVIDKQAYQNSEPERGDIVVAKYSGGLVVKRVVGLPGKKVAVKTGKIYINGALVKENHPIDLGDLEVGEGRLLPRDFATLGDNRDVAPVLAIHPIVTAPDIMGKVVSALGKRLR
jgi:signal peptidase I